MRSPVANNAQAIREKKSPDDWATFDARSLLGASLLGQKKFAEAEPFLLSGYEGLMARETKIPASSRKRIAEAAARMIQLYDAWDKSDMAEEWRKTQAMRAVN